MGKSGSFLQLYITSVVPPPTGSDGLSTRDVIGIAIGVFILLVLVMVVVALIICVLMNKGKHMATAKYLQWVGLC